MTRALLALVLVLGEFPVAAAARRRAVQHPAAPVAPAAIVNAARGAAEAAIAAGVPAVQIAVSHRGRIIYSGAFGVTDKQHATAATERTVLRIGSVTKQFTAAAILRLAERGLLTLDDRIEKHVPEFDPRGRTITLRHLLTHTSGVARDIFPPGTSFLVLISPATREQSIQSLNAQSFDFTPGSSWSYSNAAYMLLGYAIESLTGMSFADVVYREFALPLGLIDTGVCGTYNLPLPEEGYGVMGGAMFRMKSLHTSVLYAGGALCSTASDLARWSHLLATGRVMQPASYATMITAARLNNDTATTYGLGVFVQPVLGHAAVSHGGSVNGFFTSLLYLSAQEIAVAVVTNAFPAPAAAGTPDVIATTVAKAALQSPLP